MLRNMRERAGMLTVVGLLALLTIGGLTYRNRQSGEGGDALLVPMRPAEASASGSVEVEVAGGDEAQMRRSGATPADAGNEAPSPTTGVESGATAFTPLVVYVTGAVKKPGVLKMKEGDRIYQAVEKAGGFKPNAVQDSLNLADRLQDGDQIHVPSRAALVAAVAPRPAAAMPTVRHATSRPIAPVAALASRRNGGATVGRATPTGAAPRPGRILGKSVVPAATASSLVASSPANGASDAAQVSTAARTGGSSKLKNPGEGVVNINTADAAELQRLPRVGPAMAERILTYRQQIGGFTSIEQLLDVKGVGEKTLAKWQPFVTVR